MQRILHGSRVAALALAGVLLAAESARGQRVPRPANDSARRAAATGAAAAYTPAMMELIRRTTPGGAQLTPADIERRLLAARPDTTRRVTPTAVTIAPPPTDTLRAAPRGRETRVIMRIASAPPRRGPTISLRGRLERRGDQTVAVVPPSGETVVLDYSESEGFALPAWTPRQVTLEAFSDRTPAGAAHLTLINDQQGLLYATESRLGPRPATRPAISVMQEALPGDAPSRITRCYRMFRPPVVISSGASRLRVPPGGRRAWQTATGERYYVEIARSERYALINCGVAVEVPEARIEYVIRRIDDPAEFARIQQELRGERASSPTAPADPAGRGPGDGPPNTSLPADPGPRRPTPPPDQ